MKLTNTEINVLLVAIDHMEEHITELMELRELRGGMWEERLDANKATRITIFCNYTRRSWILRPGWSIS